MPVQLKIPPLLFSKIVQSVTRIVAVGSHNAPPPQFAYFNGKSIDHGGNVECHGALVESEWKLLHPSS